MEDLKSWFASKDYNEGLILLEKYSKNTKETTFLKANAESPQKMHLAIMEKRIANIIRIASQNSPSKKESKPAIEVTKPIEVKKIHYSEVGKTLEHRKQLTNKLLAYTWNDMSKKEKAYFKNSEQMFKAKKELLIENSKIESELKTLHAQLHTAKDDEERKPISKKLVNLKKKQTENWKQIDDFENFKVPEKVVDTLPKDDGEDKVELMKRRSNLRSRKTKLEKQLDDTEHKNYESRKQKYEEVVKELEEIESKIS